MDIKACIFDLDGVICDTARYHFLAWKKLADKLGIRFTESDNERLKGVSRAESLEILLSLGDKDKSYTEEEKLEFCRWKNDVYVSYISEMKEDEILPGVLEFLGFCKQLGIKTALGSVSKNAKTIIHNLKLNSCFDAVVDGNMVARAKPDPEVFKKGAEAVQALPEECVVFEDAQAGIEAARAAGMYAVGIGSPARLKEADLVISGFRDMSPMELLGMISQ